MTIKVLVVEDDTLARTIASLILKQLNCEIVFAETGVEAINKLEKNSYDLVFMDIGLPDINGVEVTKKVRILNTNSFPIVALTANYDESHKSTCIEAGMQDFLNKPLTKEKAQTIIDKWVTKYNK